MKDQDWPEKIKTPREVATMIVERFYQNNNLNIGGVTTTLNNWINSLKHYELKKRIEIEFENISIMESNYSDAIWMQLKNGEGSEFSRDELDKVLVEFFNKNF